MKYIDEVPHLDELKVEDINQGLGDIVDVLRPNWNKDNIKIEDRSTGYINKNYYCYVEKSSDDAIFVRIINARVPGQVEKAVNSMRYLRRVKLGAQLLLTFSNGLVMEFIQGEQVTWDCISKVKEPATWLSYAREMARFHGTTNLEYANKFSIPSHEASVMRFIGMLNASIGSGKVPKEALAGLHTPNEILEWGQQIYQQLLDAGAETKFCHLDANPTNLVIQDDKTVAIVDYDDCYMDLTCMEMSGAFGTLCGILDFSVENMPTDDEKEQFLRTYLEARREFEPERGPVTEKLVRYWQFLLRKSELNGLLGGVGVIIMLQNVSDKPIDMTLAHQFYAIYKETKDAVLAETWDEENC